MSPKPQVQSLEGDLCYANLSLQQPRISPGSSWKKGSSMSSSGKDHQEEVEYVTMVCLPRGCGDGNLAMPHPLESELHAHVDTADEGGV